MESYSPEITPYLMAAAEGTIIGGLLRDNYAQKWVNFFTKNFMRFDVENITAEWEGDQESTMAGTTEVWESMIDFFKAKTVDEAKECHTIVRGNVSTALNLLIGTDDNFATEFANACSALDSKTEARKLGFRRADEHEAENDSVRAAVAALSVAIWRFRLYTQLHLASLAAGKDKNNLLSHSLPLLQKLAVSRPKVCDMFMAATWPTRMVMHDLLDLKDGVDVIQHLSSKARNRILLQCEGFGGFQVKFNNAIVEITTFFAGNSGIFMRRSKPFDDPVPKYNDLDDVETVPYYGNLTFGADVELTERTVLGWVTSVKHAEQTCKRVTDKSFLDRLAPGATSVSKLVLYMNWYFGGMSSWYPSVDGDSAGCLMRQDCTDYEHVTAVNAMKIDVHFRIADVIACSKLPKTGSIRDLIHHTFDYRRGDIVVYKRKKTVGLAVNTGFEPEDCQFQMLQTLVGEQDKLRGKRWFVDDIADFVASEFSALK